MTPPNPISGGLQGTPPGRPETSPPPSHRFSGPRKMTSLWLKHREFFGGVVCFFVVGFFFREKPYKTQQKWYIWYMSILQKDIEDAVVRLFPCCFLSCLMMLLITSKRSFRHIKLGKILFKNHTCQQIGASQIANTVEITLFLPRFNFSSFLSPSLGPFSQSQYQISHSLIACSLKSRSKVSVSMV